jgi:hypothetical protein
MGQQIGTAMLSYAKHGKFPALTQEHMPFCGAKRRCAADVNPVSRCPLSSGPRVVRERNGSPLRHHHNPGERCSDDDIEPKEPSAT